MVLREKRNEIFRQQRPLQRSGFNFESEACGGSMLAKNSSQVEKAPRWDALPLLVIMLILMLRLYKRKLARGGAFGPGCCSDELAHAGGASAVSSRAQRRCWLRC